MPNHYKNTVLNPHTPNSNSLELGLNFAYPHLRIKLSTTAKGQDQLIQVANPANVNDFFELVAGDARDNHKAGDLRIPPLFRCILKFFHLLKNNSQLNCCRILKIQNINIQRSHFLSL